MKKSNKKERRENIEKNKVEDNSENNDSIGLDNVGLGDAFLEEGDKELYKRLYGEDNEYKKGFCIPKVLTADELLDKAFKRGAKVEVEDKVRIFRIRKTTSAKIDSVSQTIVSTLENYIEKFPSLERLPEFYAELIDILIGLEKLKKSLGALDWCARTVSRIAKANKSQINRSKSEKFIASKQRAAYGRIASVVKQIGKELLFLDNARRTMHEIPAIDLSEVTIVVAGYPNVGKSMLVKAISSAEPDIAPYPFTTKGILVGHFKIDNRKYQVIDTPGLLDRPIEERNKIEKMAVIALKHLADVIVFMLDPTETCGYAMEKQLNLLKEIKMKFGDIPIYEVENKYDLAKKNRMEKKFSKERYKISASTREGIDRLLEDLIPYAAKLAKEKEKKKIREIDRIVRDEEE